MPRARPPCSGDGAADCPNPDHYADCSGCGARSCHPPVQGNYGDWNYALCDGCAARYEQWIVDTRRRKAGCCHVGECEHCGCECDGCAYGGIAHAEDFPVREWIARAADVKGAP